MEGRKTKEKFHYGSFTNGTTGPSLPAPAVRVAPRARIMFEKRLTFNSSTFPKSMAKASHQVDLAIV